MSRDFNAATVPLASAHFRSESFLGESGKNSVFQDHKWDAGRIRAESRLVGEKLAWKQKVG
jgi:hypothetical protein